MVAVLMEIGQGRRAVDCIPVLLAAKDREQARGTAPAAGLYMKKCIMNKMNYKLI